MTVHNTDIATRRADIIANLGLTYSATFVPFSHSRNAEEKHPSLNWRVTISKGRHTLTTDYTQGVGYIPGYRYRAALTLAGEKIVRLICESGRVPKTYRADPYSTGFSTVPLPAPTLEEVLYSLSLDAGALDAPSFEEWASECGYDTDSRKRRRKRTTPVWQSPFNFGR